MGWRMWCSGRSPIKTKYRYEQNFQDNWCSTDKDMENSAQWWPLSKSSSKGTTPFTRRSPCTILWMAATIVTNSVWYSVNGQGSIYLGWNYQYKQFTFLEIRKSTPPNAMPFSAAISVNVHHIPRHGIHGTLQPDKTPWVSILIQMIVCTAQDGKTVVIV